MRVFNQYRGIHDQSLNVLRVAFIYAIGRTFGKWRLGSRAKAAVLFTEETLLRPPSLRAFAIWSALKLLVHSIYPRASLTAGHIETPGNLTRTAGAARLLDHLLLGNLLSAS